MSYDIYLTDPVSGDTLHTRTPHHMEGGTHAMNGTTEMWLNVTYNYYEQFRKAFGVKGIRTIYGMSGAKSIPLIRKGIDKLGDDTTDNYWEATEGNAKKALNVLLALASMRPDGVWEGD